MQTPITPFLLVGNSNESILQKADQKLKFLRIQKMTLSQPTTLKSFVQQIRNYQAYTHLVIDVSIVEERDDDFIEALEAIQMFRDDMRLIIYAVDLKNGEDFFDTLVNRGFTNIVAVLNKNLDETAKWEQIQKDILECFSEKGLSEKRWRMYQKVDLAAKYEAERQARAEEESKRKIPDFSQTYIKICVFGTGGRVGATTAALTIASYFSAGNADVKVILRSNKQVSALKKYLNIFDGSDEKEFFSCGENIIFTSSREQSENENFNTVIEDMGKYGNEPLQSNALNIIVADVSFDGIENSLLQLCNANLAESKPFKVIVNLCDDEKWRRVTESGLIDREMYDYAENPPLLLPFVKEKMIFEKTEKNITAFNTFFKF